MSLELALGDRPRAAARSPLVWSKAAGCVLLGTMCGLLIVLWVATHFLGYGLETIQSGSMQPTLSRGDIIFTRPVTIDDVAVGDIITFDEGRDVHLTIAHRVESFVNVNTTINNTTTGAVTTEKSRLLRTKGDANASPDVDPVDSSRLRGEVVLTIPKVGLIMGRVPLQAGFAAIFVLTGVGWAGYELVRHRRTRRQLVDVAEKSA